jgi:hypothetical protein
MPRLFNAENCLFETFALTSLDSDESQTVTFTGLTTADFVCVLYNDDMQATTQSGFDASVTAANTIMFTPTGASGAGTAVSQTVGILALVNPTSGQEGGSW